MSKVSMLSVCDNIMFVKVVPDFLYYYMLK